MSHNQKVIEKVEVIVANFRHLEQKMSDPTIASDNNAYTKLAKQYRELEPIAKAHARYREAANELKEYEAILSGKNDDPELYELAKESIDEARERHEALYFELQRLLLPKDPLDERNIILEIRAGTGGDEAGLFAAEMFRAYSRFADSMGWKVNITNANESGLGGMKEVTAVIEGNNVYSTLKYESGTHRVQRVPATETQGRVHTSAITVAILPEAEDVEVEVLQKDIRIDTFRSSGAGGQHINTTDSAVRLTHMPSGIVISCQDERSKIKNTEKAMRVLRAQLYDMKVREQNEKIAADRKSMVGSGDRSEKIRTYNFPQGRVTDHRAKVTIYQLDDYMNGNMKEMMEACRAQFEAQRIQEQFGQA